MCASVFVCLGVIWKLDIKTNEQPHSFTVVLWRTRQTALDLWLLWYLAKCGLLSAKRRLIEMQHLGLLFVKRPPCQTSGQTDTKMI